MKNDTTSFLPNRSKKLISITAFFAAFVFSAAFAGLFVDNSASSTVYSHNHTNCFHLQYDTVTADAITDLLKEDQRIGNSSFRQLGEISPAYLPPFGTRIMTEYSDVVANLADDMENINDRNLPRDVRQSWRKHIIAWKDYADFLKHQENLNYSQEELELKNARYNVEISKTYYELLHDSSSYGAFIYQ